MKAKVYVSYPERFLCWSKFARKVSRYTSDLRNFQILATDDPNSFTSKYCSELGISLEVDASSISECSHAIVFHDPRSPDPALDELKERKVACKRIDLVLASVVNKDHDVPYDVYIGRGTVWGNPYPIGVHGDREEVLRKYAYDLERRYLRFFEEHDKNVDAIRGKVLGCHCKPAACHGDLLANYVNSLDDGA